jgi:hypothetical protein
MLKRFTLAVAAFLALAGQPFAAGTVPGFSLTPQFDLTGKIAPGCLLYVIQAGTVSTPQQPYQDSGLTLLSPNPLTCDAAGRLPQWFVADGSIKLRLTKSNGVQIFVGDNLLVVGASSGGGGGSPVDPTTIMATGDMKDRYGTGILTGFVRANGRTVGSASSGATERANADAQALFEYLWGADVNLAVSTGRGASANADWTANKTIALPDHRGRGRMALDDMGASASGRLTTASCATPTTLGTGCGTETKTFAQGNLPALTWPKTLAIGNTLGISDTRTWVTSNPLYPSAGTPGGIGAGSNTGLASAQAVVVSGGSIGLTGGVSLTGDTTSGGSGTPLSSLAPVLLITTYIKL